MLNENGVIKYKKSNLDSILNDFEKVTQELNLVKRPVASLYIKNMEIGYAYGHIDGDEWVSSKDKGFGINEKGMFVRIGLNYTWETEHKHFKELKKGEEYFDDFLQLGGMHMWKFNPTKHVLNKVDRITHNFKSANIVHGKTLKKLEEFVHMAQKEKKSIEIY